MIRSQEIALRCAAALPSNLLRHPWKSDARLAADMYGAKVTLNTARQLDACKDDAARRLLLGRSR